MKNSSNNHIIKLEIIVVERGQFMNESAQFFKDTMQTNKYGEIVFRTIQQHQKISKIELLKSLSFKKTTLVRTLDMLESNKLISVDGELKNGIGRPSITYKVNASFGYLVGIHISRMKLNIVLLDLGYEVMDTQSIYITSFHTPILLVRFIKDTIEKFMQIYLFPVSKLLNIGVCAVGPIDRENGMILSNSSLMSHQTWRNFNIKEELATYFHCDVTLEKSANSSVIAENYYLSTKSASSKNILYFISGGWGLDCGIIYDGGLLGKCTVDGTAYEHMVINFDGPLCNCGNRGCLISYTSFESILNLLQRSNRTFDYLETIDVDKASVQDVVSFLQSDDELVQSITLNTAEYLAYGVANMINLYNPNLVILSGPLIENISGYYEKVVHHLKQNLSIDTTRIQFSNEGKLKNNAGAIGAAMRAMDLLYDTF